MPISRHYSPAVSRRFDCTEWRSLNRMNRNQIGEANPSAVRADLDDPPIHIRPIVPAISGCKAKEPFRFRPLRRSEGGTTENQSQRIFCRKRQESGDKRLNEHRQYHPSFPRRC
jgi:hypothetical protein